jgi:hypothetical protein
LGMFLPVNNALSQRDFWSIDHNQFRKSIIRR